MDTDQTVIDDSENLWNREFKKDADLMENMDQD